MLLTLAAVLVLAACNGSDDDGPTEPEAGEPGTAEDDTAPASDDSDDDAPLDDEVPSEDDGDDETPSGDVGDPDGGASDDPAEDAGDDQDSPFTVRTGTLELDEPIEEPYRHRGVQFAVTRVTVEPMAILVDIELLNGWTDDVALGAADPRLEDNTGRSYEYVPPEENPRLETPAGGSLSATLAFRGALATDATRFDLQLNALRSGSGQPSITVRDLPLPAAD